MRKAVLKEIQKLKDEKISLDTRIKEIIDECSKVEDEYASVKSELVAKNLSLAKTEDLQKIELDKLDDLIEEYEMKIGVVNDDLKNMEISYRENSFELAKLKAELDELKLRSQKELKTMKNDLGKTNKALEDGEQMEQDLEKYHEEAMSKAKTLYERKMQQTQDSFARRFKRAEENYNNRVEPLLLRIQSLDAEIQELEDKILERPKELKALRNKQARLLQKFPKGTYCS